MRVLLLATLVLMVIPEVSAAQSDGVEPYRPSRLFLSSKDQGPWLAADKELHFAGSLAIAASLRIEGQTRRTSVGVTFGIGLLKEIYDVALKPRRMGRGASWKDLAADLAGAVAGTALAGALD
jgi:uncharacterized protein YfiM (DUF2279 family)